MKRKNKGIIIVAFIMFIMLSACGNNANPSAGKSDGQTTPNVDVNDSPKAALASLKFYYRGNEYQLPMSIEDSFALFSDWKSYNDLVAGHKLDSEDAYLESGDQDSFRLREDVENAEDGYLSLTGRNFSQNNCTPAELTLTGVSVWDDTPYCEEYELPGGIGIGSTRQEVIDTYGEPLETYSEKGKESLYYQERVDVTVGNETKYGYTGAYVDIDESTGRVVYFAVRYQDRG